MAEVTVHELIRAFDFRNTHDHFSSYLELSALSQDLALLMLTCRPGEVADKIKVWQYVRGSGMYRRSQTLCVAATGRPPFHMSEDAFHSWYSIDDYAEWLRELSTELAQQHRRRLIVQVTGTLVPVLDGVWGPVEQHGVACTEEAALEIARQTFVDEVSHAEFTAEPVTLADGTVVRDGAWVVITAHCAHASRQTAEALL